MLIYLINSLGQNLEIREKLCFLKIGNLYLILLSAKRWSGNITKVNPCDELGRLWWGDNIQILYSILSKF